MTMPAERNVPVSGPRASALEELFAVGKPVIGTVHLLPLPGAPRYRGEPIAVVVEQAVRDAREYVQGGVDGLIVENEGDIPFRKPGDVGHDTVAALAVVTVAVRQAVDVPVGVNCLANAVVQSIAVAKAAGGRFVRANQWTNAYVANEGIIEGAAAEALRFRSRIHGEDIRILADVHVKHGSHAIVADRDIAELTHDAEAFDADVLIATGQRTGDPTQVGEVTRIKEVATRPVIVGSGLTAANAAELLKVADGAIVGSAMKHDGVWWNPVDRGRVAAIMDQVAKAR
jgi:membrane complex biogenesis BtpA family protein